ncbi:MAG: putative AAA ATPase, partial [Halothiobacillaceae bacterium]
IAILADGHLLIEGVPGLAKTTAVRALATGLDLSFQRIQFTPDLIPGDITGTDIFTPQTGAFQFVSGPIFNEIILADEINRAPPKVQSALLEAMQEQQVTVGGISRKLSAVFVVIATQNPLEHEGTYPLPEAQLDRFFMKITLDYPTADEKEQLLATRRQVNAIYLDEMLQRYIIALVNATRDPSPWLPEITAWISYGASPRASLALARAARALAYLRQRDFVEPGDILDVAFDVLNHRLGLSFSARAEGVTRQQLIEQITAAVPIP